MMHHFNMRRVFAAASTKKGTLPKRKFSQFVKSQIVDGIILYTSVISNDQCRWKIWKRQTIWKRQIIVAILAEQLAIGIDRWTGHFFGITKWIFSPLGALIPRKFTVTIVA